MSRTPEEIVRQWQALGKEKPMVLPTNIFPGGVEVLGRGSASSDWFFVGDSPGYHESIGGAPFIGPSGRILVSLLTYFTDLRRSNVYMTNVIKHAPPRYHTLKAKEIKAYLPSFIKELEQRNPKVVVTIGAPAAKVFDKTVKLKDDHGIAKECTLGEWSGILIPWYHPFFAISNVTTFEGMVNDASRLHTEANKIAQIPLHLDYKLVEEAEAVSYLLEHWGDIGFDTETTGFKVGKVLMHDQCRMIGYSISWTPGQGVYVATTKMGPGMAAIMESPLWHKICHNAKFEHKILQTQGIQLINYDDTQLVAYLLGEDKVGLKHLAIQHLGADPISYKDVTGGKDMSELLPSDIATYAAMDADHTLRLWTALYPRLRRECLVEVYNPLELECVPVLDSMEHQGMLVDNNACKEVEDALTVEVVLTKDRVKQAFKDVGFEDYQSMNIDSGDQIADKFVKLGAPLVKKTKSGDRFAVDTPVLEDIEYWKPELVKPLLEYRKLTKLVGYVNSFQKLQGPDHRLHTSFNQSGHFDQAGGEGSAPSTGRVSSSGPNLQNIPHHRAKLNGVNWGDELRKCIVARPGWTILSADLGQEEPRIVAVLAQDQTLLNGFANGDDIYRPATMSLYPHTLSNETDQEWKVKWEDWERFIGKTFFLAWYYGAGAGRLKDMDAVLSKLDIHRGLSLLAEAHPARQKYLDDTWDFLSEHGYVESMSGRKRWISKAWSPNAKDRADALREAANMRVQGTAADILKRALPRIHNELKEMEAMLVSTVHDEVILEVPMGEIDEVAKVVQKAFGDQLPGVKLILETFVGERWSERRRLT